jgi:hypothetical protein
MTTVGLLWSICNAEAETCVHHEDAVVLCLNLVMRFIFVLNPIPVQQQVPTANGQGGQSAKTGGGKGQGTNHVSQ